MAKIRDAMREASARAIKRWGYRPPPTQRTDPVQRSFPPSNFNSNIETDENSSAQKTDSEYLHSTSTKSLCSYAEDVGSEGSQLSTASSSDQTQEPASPRKFPASVQRDVWENAPEVPGRDKSRWRLDAVDNPVLFKMRGFPGPFGWELDHIKPWSDDGPSDLDNCQILQFRVNRDKAASTNFSKFDMEMSSPHRKYTKKEMDLAEELCYGDVCQPNRKCKVMSKRQTLGIQKIEGFNVYCAADEDNDHVIRYLGSPSTTSPNALTLNSTSDEPPRKFSTSVQRVVWENSPEVPGRHKSRWRFDAAGNPVLWGLRGFPGPFGWEMDHIKPC